MIVRSTSNWLRMLFVWDGSVLQAIIPQLLLMLVISSLALLTDGRVFGVKIPLDTAPFPMVGISLAIFLGFRNNASYARFAEARHIWGQLLIAARALASQAITYLPQETSGLDHQLLLRRLVAFVYAQAPAAPDGPAGRPGALPAGRRSAAVAGHDLQACRRAAHGARHAA